MNFPTPSLNKKIWALFLENITYSSNFLLTLDHRALISTIKSNIKFRVLQDYRLEYNAKLREHLLMFAGLLIGLLSNRVDFLVRTEHNCSYCP
ncbi:hypothetical protein BpHYR1_040878 [Brachionus plicatilis]|uniref:Uncharacterized protein n=1 Tax=Brachionus plicatilis TaxID=10195 RepID=A0A3M7T859_BRAPC|nr:hypothetical protein BpHYR1_040878 [Brachionus plicatilis]